jgi:hypothetical protein
MEWMERKLVSVLCDAQDLVQRKSLHAPGHRYFILRQSSWSYLIMISHPHPPPTCPIRSQSRPIPTLLLSTSLILIRLLNPHALAPSLCRVTNKVTSRCSNTLVRTAPHCIPPNKTKQNKAYLSSYPQLPP